MELTRGRGGLTFIELLIAATMISILFVGLGSHLRGGIAVWEQATKTVEVIQRRRVAMERLGRDLANAFLYDTQPEAAAAQEFPWPDAEFGASQLTWYTVIPATSRTLPSVRVVSYACERIEGRQGLWRRSQTVGQARQRRIPPVPELLLEGCETMAVRYAYLPSQQSGAEALDWRSNWRQGDAALPRLIDVSLELDGMTLRRTFEAPGGELTTYEQETQASP